MKRILLILVILAQLVMSQAASATIYTFGDTANNWPGWGTPAENSMDVIGTPRISGGSVDLNTGNLTNVNINATYLLLHPEFYSGDLFINILRSGNDTTWDYVVKTLGNTAGGSAAIYDVRNLGITVGSAGSNASYVMSSWPVPTNVRDNHPIGISFNSNVASVGDATFSGLTSTGVSYDLGNLLNLEGYNNILLAWTVNCANDVLYEQVPVPEPGTMVLLGAGLLSLVVYSKRRMGKSA